jgi:quercetin dioxygenase-like cupin family protein
VSTLRDACERIELVSVYALGAVPENELAAVEAHITGCADCTAELARLRPVVDSLASVPADILRPPASLWERLSSLVGNDTRERADEPESARWSEPEWEEVAPGIACKLLASDTERQRVSMLVRLDPDTAYPPHTHAGFEELHLLEGELWIGDRKLEPGDYNRAEAGTVDVRVWSETGCTCVLITSPQDVLR